MLDEVPAFLLSRTRDIVRSLQIVTKTTVEEKKLSNAVGMFKQLWFGSLWFLQWCNCKNGTNGILAGNSKETIYGWSVSFSSHVEALRFRVTINFRSSRTSYLAFFPALEVDLNSSKASSINEWTWSDIIFMSDQTLGPVCRRTEESSFKDESLIWQEYSQRSKTTSSCHVYSNWSSSAIFEI